MFRNLSFCESAVSPIALPVQGFASLSAFSTFLRLNAQVSRLHLLIVCQFCASAVHDYLAAFQHIGPLH